MPQPIPEKKMLSVICPCYNEFEAISLFYKELKKTLLSLSGIEHEIIFVDDGSDDDTLSILNEIANSDCSVKVYSFSRNFGHQLALTAGLDVAKGDAIVMMDSDLQHPPSLIPELINKWNEGYEIVSAVRKTTDGVSFFKRFSSKVFYKILNSLSNTNIPEGAADFCLLSRKAHHALLEMPESHRFLRGMVSWIGMKRAYVPYTASKRVAGQSKYSLVKMVLMASEALLSFSSAPLKLATRMGFFVTFSGFVYLTWILLRFFIVKDLVSGWGSLICVVLILGGFQLSFLGLIGQYLARIFEEVKGRPLYILKQKPGDLHDHDG